MGDYDYRIGYEIQEEMRRLQATYAATLTFRAQRVAIRTARLICGFALFVAGLVVIGAAPNVSDTPFAALTLGAIFESVAAWGFGILLLYWAAILAFGAAPTRDEMSERFRAEATDNVNAGRAERRQNT